MKLTAITGNTQKLDGGAMFGNAPKALWSQWITPDEQNRIPLACRSLLIQDGDKTILCETGTGLCFDPALRERYGIEGDTHLLLNKLNAMGMTENDIDIVILSHLHFDHAGGLLSPWEANTPQRLLFPKANYLVSKAGWERAIHPHSRDRASFIPTLNALLESSDRLVIVNDSHCPLLSKQFQFSYTDGHTVGLMHTTITPKDVEPVIFASDLIPGTPWVHLPITMGYDRAPECLINEKQAMLDHALQHNAWLFYTHDSDVAASKVTRDDKGRYSAINKQATLALAF